MPGRSQPDQAVTPYLLTRMADQDYINASGEAPDVYAIVYAYPVSAVDRNSAVVKEFFESLRAHVDPGMIRSGGPGSGLVEPRTPLVILSFTLDQIPVPLEDVIEWLRNHSLIRVIEVDRFRDREP